MSVARVVAQAKLNLLLHVLERQVSGFHSLETVFLRIELGDDVSVRVASGRSLECSGPAMPHDGLGPTEKNLAFRAAVAYAEATGWPTGFAVEITKRIPVGGGLGGGSADAGAVLRALDALAPHPLGSRLPALATALGSDVPFLTTDAPMAVGWSRGERLLAVPPLMPRPALLLVPNVAISTAEAYGWLAADRHGYAPAASVLSLHALEDWEALAAIARNDFERVVARRHPEIAELVDQLRAEGAELAMLSGSGSTVFGIFSDAPDVGSVARNTGQSVIVTATSDRVRRVIVGD